MNKPPSRPDHLLYWPQVFDLIGLSRSTVRRLERAGKFPPHIRVSPGRVAWRASEIHDFVAGRWQPTTDAT